MLTLDIGYYRHTQHSQERTQYRVGTLETGTLHRHELEGGRGVRVGGRKAIATLLYKILKSLSQFFTKLQKGLMRYILTLLFSLIIFLSNGDRVVYPNADGVVLGKRYVFIVEGDKVVGALDYKDVVAVLYRKVM